MFRIPSIDGLIIDAVLARRGMRPIEDEYYKEIATNHEQGTFRLQNKEQGNILRVDMSNVVLIKDAYESEAHINTEKALIEFESIWITLNEILEMYDVRRIGIAAEFQIESSEKNPNIPAMELLCKLKTPPHPGKFHLRFEDRRETKEGVAPDVDKSDFVNVIYDFYDSELDAEHPSSGGLNANIDYQKYFSPLLSRNIWDEVKIQSRKFESELKSFKTLLKEYKLVS
jgi:hypothetical protein